MSLFAKPNDIHQADILYLPHDRYEKRLYKYALNIVDVASRYKGSYQLATKNAKEVAQSFQWIYENTQLTYPKTLIVDDGKEFYGDVTKKALPMIRFIFVINSTHNIKHFKHRVVFFCIDVWKGYST